MKFLFAGLLLSLFLFSCGNDDSGNRQMNIQDLPYHRAVDAKTYADLILKTIRTNRDRPLAREFAHGTPLNRVQLNRIVGMYSTGIGGRKDWQYYDFYELGDKTDQTGGFDYAWLDPKGRLGIQIFILPKLEGERFVLDKIEFRSRIDVMESVAFPGGPIDDYKKINYDWDNW